MLAEALVDFFDRGDERGLVSYSDTCLRRVWRVQQFSWWMTSTLHRFEGDDGYDRRRQLSQLDYVCSSRTAAASLAENYVGLEQL